MDRLTFSAKLDGWIPARFYWFDEQPRIDWCYRSKHGINSPSFARVVEDCLQHPFNLLFSQQTAIDALQQLHETRPGMKPTAFIFHMSRSGSTLVSRMLAALSRNLVISEARPIDSILRAHFRNKQVTDEQQIDWLRWIVSALGQPWFGSVQNFFIKFDAWNTLELPLIKRAFPEVPWVFIYGEAVEEITSQLSHREAHMIPGVIDACLFGLSNEEVAVMEPEEYCARVLASICEAALAHQPNGGILVNKTALPLAFSSPISPFFGVGYSEDELETLRRVVDREGTSTVSAQNGGGEKKEIAAASIREAAVKWLYPAYEKLELHSLARRADR